MRFSMVIKKILFEIVFLLGLLFIPAIALAQTAPPAPPDLLVSYPSCDGAACSFVNAKCTWGASVGAASYTIKITEVETSTIVKTESLPSTTLTYTFPVTPGKTYKCDVNAVSSTGTAGAVASYSLLCKTDVAGPTVAPTATPTPVPTKPVVTIPPKPPEAGNETFLILASILGLGALIFGGLLFKL